MIPYSERKIENVMKNLGWLMVVGKQEQAGDVGLVLSTNEAQQTQIVHLILSDHLLLLPLLFISIRRSIQRHPAYGNMSS